MLIIREPWTRQPQVAAAVDWGNTLTRGLVFLLDRITAPAMSIRDVSGRAGAAINEYTDTTFQRTERVTTKWGSFLGLSVEYQNTEMLFPTTALNAAFAATGAATSVSILRSINAVALPSETVLKLAKTEVGEFYPFSSDSKIYIGPFSGTRWVEAVTPPSSITVPHMLAATHSGTAQVCYFNNAVIASASITETPSCLGASFGGGDDTNPNNWHGALYFQAFWNRALTAAEIASLNANPWQLFAPRRIYIPTAAAAAGAPTITALSAIGITATSAQPRITYA